MADEYYSGAYTGAEIDAGIAAAMAAMPRTEAEAALAAIKDGTNIDSFGDVETALTGKADKSTTYTKTEVDALLTAGKYVESKLFSGTATVGDIFTYTLPAGTIARVTAQMMYTNGHPEHIEIVSMLGNTAFMCASKTTTDFATTNCITASAIVGPRGGQNVVKVRGNWTSDTSNWCSILVEILNTV